MAENLSRQEKREIERLEKGQTGEGGDFGAYHALLTGKGGELAAAHAVSQEGYLASYSRQLRSILDGFGLKGRLAILDVGCGPGALTNALRAAAPQAQITGIDISESAIAYAQKTYPNCRFTVVSVDENMRLETFDVVHSREFYPFTRTADIEFHREYLRILARHVSPNGTLILTLRDTPKSLSRNASALSADLEQLGMTPFRRILLANAALPRWIPPSIARAVTSGVLKLLGRDEVHFYVSRRTSATS